MTLTIGPVRIPVMTPLDGVNLLLGKEATFSLKPNYNLTAGGDAFDLTDGKFWGGGNRALWSSKRTVGWKFGRKPGVLITFDLQHIYAMEAFSFSTAAGAAQVTFPAAVIIYVSDDGKTWHYVTNLINETIAQDRYVYHRFTAMGLRTRGRHVALYVAKGGHYGFVDEIELIQGIHDPSAVFFRNTGVDQAKLEADALTRAKRIIPQNITRYLVRAARDQVVSMAGGDAKITLDQLHRLESLTFNHTVKKKIDYSKGLPYTELDQAVCRVMGKFFSGHEKAPIALWQPTISFWSHRTNPFERPVQPILPRLHADMMLGEYEPVAFNVSNNTAKPAMLRVQVSDLLGTEREERWPNALIKRRITTYVVASGFLFFDDALAPIKNEYILIPPGMTRQVWLILHSQGITSQRYEGTATVAYGSMHFELPLTATVYPIEMPSNPTYISHSWAYFTSFPAKGFEKQAADELRAAYENAQVIHHAYIPWPKVDKVTKKLIRPVELDFTKLDEMLVYRPYVKQWLLWPGFEFGLMNLNYYHAIDMPPIGTPEHERLFKEWVRQIRDFMQAKGVLTGHWAFYWVDEPNDEMFEKYVVPASKLAKQVDPTILVWENHQVSLETLEKNPSAIDIHSCPLSYYRRNPRILKYALGGKFPSVQYVTGSAKFMDPYRYYRLHHMASVALGLDGAGMWVWGDDGGQFSDYDGPYPSYGMVYATEEGPITSKRREAWREGIEDVELWRHLRYIAQKTRDLNLQKLARLSPFRLVQQQRSVAQENLMEIRLKILKVIALKLGNTALGKNP